MKKGKYKVLIILICILCFTPLYKTNLELKEMNVNSDTNQEDNSSYLAVLEIPRINLKKEIYSANSPFNTVNKNIELIEGSTMPDQKYGCVILAAHSGASSIAYFKNLDKLKIGEEAILYYQQIKYVYVLQNVYQEEKDGSITIRREKYTNNLILITCNKKNNNLQDVYVFKQF